MTCGEGRRPTLWTPERQEALQAAASAGMTVAEAAEALGLTKVQIYGAVKKYKIGLAPAVRPAKLTPLPPEAALRARWEKLLPELKASLVRQLERIA